jgi:hypothetical protein
MREAFELTPILVAGTIAAVLFVLYESLYEDSTMSATTLGVGFGIGAACQIGVRLLGVS